MSNSLLGIQKGKTYKITNFSSESLVLFFASDSLQSLANHSHLSFLMSKLLTDTLCKEGCEQISHGHSFVKRDVSESLTVALL